MWATRRATPEDLPGLRELCVDSAGADDYVLGFLDRFVRDSVTFAARDGERIVGMMVYDDTPDGGAWLHAARTRPAYRRQGVATALMSECERLARHRHRTAMRLWASADNVASVRANRKYGYREMARFTRMRANAAAGGVRLDPLDWHESWSTLESSDLLQRSAGYLFHDFYFIPWNRRTAGWLARQGALWTFDGNVVAVSQDFEDPRGVGLQVQALAGDVGALLRSARQIANARGASRVESFLPHHPAVLRAARRAGFRLMGWGQEAVLFEKLLRPRPRRRSSGSRPRTTAPHRHRAARRLP